MDAFSRKLTALVPEHGRNESLRLELLANHFDDLDRQTKPAGDVLARPMEMRDATEHEQVKLAQVEESSVRHPVIRPVCPLRRQFSKSCRWEDRLESSPNRALSDAAPATWTALRGEAATGAANATIRIELALLSKGFTLAVRARKLRVKPYIPKPAGDPSRVRQGFFSREEADTLCDHLDADLADVCGSCSSPTATRATSLLVRVHDHRSPSGSWALRLEFLRAQSGKANAPSPRP